MQQLGRLFVELTRQTGMNFLLQQAKRHGEAVQRGGWRRRAARNIDNGFAWQNFLQADCASWVNSSCGNTAPRRAGTDSDNGCCAFRRFADVIHNRLTGNHAINTVIF